MPLDDGALGASQRSQELIALDDGLTDLHAFDPRKARIIELRYFGGMTVEEVARTLDISTATVERETRLAQLLLARHMKGGHMKGGPID